MNGLLKGEISAVETYGQALEKVKNQTVVPTLQDCRIAHQERELLLRDKISSLGGTPVEGSGAWGAFAKFMEGSANVMGEKPSIDLLEEGEDHGLKSYRDESEKCEDAAVRSFIKNQLLPGQERTHAALSNLKNSLA